MEYTADCCHAPPREAQRVRVWLGCWVEHSGRILAHQPPRVVPLAGSDASRGRGSCRRGMRVGRDGAQQGG
jgi:hypothetical protein